MNAKSKPRLEEAVASSSPPLPPKESLAKRYKVLWRLLLVSNLALGAYMFIGARKKDKAVRAQGNRASAKVPSTTEEPAPSPPVTETVKVRQPIPEDQQRELFKWILEEKRKLKPKDPEEKRRIDEEKALLKQFIRSKSIPSI